jgi:chromosomal replication initiator protein
MRTHRSTERASVARIIGEVCRQYRVTHAELAAARRTARLMVPRQVAMFLCRRHTDAPLQAIGAELGGRDHSTVVHALGAVERRLGADAALRDIVAAVEARLIA